MVVCLIIGLLFGALFMTLSAGDASVAVNSDKVHLQAKVRALTELVIRDLRGAISWEINANNPSSVHVKCNIWSWDPAVNTWQMGSNFIEYSYDAAARTLSRRLVDDKGNVLQETVFSAIAAAPFYTTYADETSNYFDPNELLSLRRLYVVISSDRVVRGRSLRAVLVTEVKIRNG